VGVLSDSVRINERLGAFKVALSGKQVNVSSSYISNLVCKFKKKKVILSMK